MREALNLLVIISLIVVTGLAVRWFGRREERTLLSTRAMMIGWLVSSMLGACTCGICVTHPFSEHPQAPISATMLVGDLLLSAMVLGFMWAGVLSFLHTIGLLRRLLKGPPWEAIKPDTETGSPSDGRNSDNGKV